jgi:hypothetical protein
MGQLLIKIEGQFEISREKVPSFLAQKVKAKNSKIWVCQRLPKIAGDPNLVARNMKLQYSS